MSKISRPSQKVTVFDPDGGAREAYTTDADEMARRAKKAKAEADKKAREDAGKD